MRRRLEKARNHQGGFTLIELLVVIGIIVILAGISPANYQSSVARSKEAVLKEDLFRMRDAIDQYDADKGKHPARLASEGYLRQVPEDPFTKSSDTWQAIPAEPDPANLTAERGVYDLKSESDATALDGTRYSDW